MSRDDVLRECAFETERLSIFGIHSSALNERRLDVFYTELFVSENTSWLPGVWNGIDATEDGRRWIAGVEAEHGTVLLISRRSNHAPIGLLIASEQESNGDHIAHIGYLISPSSQGQGFATEAVSGLVRWIRRAGRFSSLVAGVDKSNFASVSVLEKCGFEEISSVGGDSAESMYQIDMDR